MAEERITPEIQQQIMQLQQMAGQLQSVGSQRQQMELMKAEAAEALEALEGTADDTTVWRSVGAVMVQETRAAALERLRDDVETLEIRRKRMAGQEEEMRKQFDSLQKKLQAHFGA